MNHQDLIPHTLLKNLSCFTCPAEAISVSEPIWFECLLLLSKHGLTERSENGRRHLDQTMISCTEVSLLQIGY